MRALHGSASFAHPPAIAYTRTHTLCYQVRLDDDSTALAVVSDVPEHFRGGVPGGVPQSEDDDNRYEVTFMDDQGRLALRDRLQLALPNEFVEVVYPSDTIYMQVRAWGGNGAVPVALHTWHGLDSINV